MSKKYFKTLLLTFFAFFGIAKNASAAIYYASPSGSGSICGTSSRCLLTTGVGKLTPGDTLMVGDGTYNQRLYNIPSGTAGNYVTVRAENDGQAVIVGTEQSENGVLSLNSNYVQVEGFKFVSNTDPTPGSYMQKGLDIPYPNHHNKVLRCGFVATPCTHGDCYNRANLSISGSYNLIEDCWAWGGGRYKAIIFGGDGTGQNGNHNILRRFVARHDREWTLHFNPQSGIQTYQAGNNEIQNCLVIDSNQSDYYDSSWYGAFTNAKGAWSQPNAIRGSMAINFFPQSNLVHSPAFDEGEGSNDDPLYPFGGWTITDFAAVDGGGGLFFAGAGGTADRDLVVDHILVADTLATQPTDYEDRGCGVSSSRFYNANQSERTTVTNSVFTRILEIGTKGGHGLHDVKGANNYNAFFGNTTNYSTGAEQSTAGANDITNTDPLTASILYPVRVESGSPLKGAGSGGSDIGPTILKRIGVSGTLYGETGYNTATNEDLWPWPNEARIKTDMSSYPSNWPSDGMPSPIRGFTAGNSVDGSSQTLTKYIWEYLGNEIPCDIYGTCSGDAIAPSAPSGLSVM